MSSLLPDHQKTLAGQNHDDLRVERLHDYNILDTCPETEFEDYTRFVMRLCQVPASIVSFVDESRQWFKSHPGLQLAETERCVSFCTHTIQNEAGRLLIVNDTLADSRFAHSPLVTGPEKIRFYAGAPLVTPDGYAIGALCAVDRKPRSLSTDQQESLRTLARMLIRAMEARRRHHAYLQVCEDRDRALRELEAHLAGHRPIHPGSALES